MVEFRNIWIASVQNLLPVIFFNRMFFLVGVELIVGAIYPGLI